ncbi:MAG: hypothetical protein ACRYFS_25995 [Janthinobacterium lividum]
MPYPEQSELMRDLVLNDHTVIEETPLILAIYFKSRRVPVEECLFEVLHRFGLDEVSEERSIFQIQFGRTPNFPLPEGDRLRLFLTNSVEMNYAIANSWPEVVDLCESINSEQFEEIYRNPNDPDAARIWDDLTKFAHALARNAVPV